MAQSKKGKSGGAGNNSNSKASKSCFVDRLIIGSFGTFCVIGIFIDYINAVAPVGGVSPEAAKTWSWPPQFMFPAYFWWCRAADPILHLNPMWIKYLSWLSPFVFCPFYIVAIYGVYNRKDWIRMPIVVYASILFVDLSAFFVEAIYGEIPSPSMALFTLGYGYYQIFPLILLKRFWKDNPFGHSKSE